MERSERRPSACEILRSSRSECWPKARLRGVDAGFHREHALDELRGGHLDREEGDGRRLALGGRLREVEDERGFSKAGPRRDDDEVAALEAGGEDRIEVHEAGGYGPDVAGDCADARCR